MERHGWGPVAGFVLLVLGLLFLFGQVFSMLWFVARLTGPLVLIALGVYFLSRQRKGDFPWPLFLILGGAIAFLGRMGFWFLGLGRVLGPAALIVIGAWLLLGRRRERE